MPVHFIHPAYGHYLNVVFTQGAGLLPADEHFFETTKMSLVSGRTFDKNRPSDKDAIIITETTCALVGVAVTRYVMVKNFKHVMELHIDK